MPARWPNPDLLATAALVAAATLAEPVHAATTLPEQGDTAQIPLGDVPGLGGARQQAALGVKNPFDGKPEAVTEGKQLFRSMNCAYCHAFEAKGLMGPSLADHYWRYGGAPSQLYKSIYEGRPQGMPAWGATLPSDSIWKIVSYLESLGGTVSKPEARNQGDQPGPQDTNPANQGKQGGHP
jgi:cytochrome c oxidase cbb3-type subunit 3